MKTIYLPVVLDSKILKIGSTYSWLRSEIQVWIDQNCVHGYTFEVSQTSDAYELTFFDDSDATSFILKWL